MNLTKFLNSPTTEFWNIWTSVLPLAILIHISLPHPSTVHLACIICQLCSTIYHTFNFLTPILYNLDLAGICCMSLGSPSLYELAYGKDGLEQYTTLLILLTLICFALLITSTLRGEVSSTCEPLILILAAVGNYPTLHFSAAMVGMAIVLSAYVLFKNLRLPESLLPNFPAVCRSHVLWHCAVFAGQLCYIHTVTT
jgi:predicted membrane channel-forming protein YqfA (hemolysin III family)